MVRRGPLFILTGPPLLTWSNTELRGRFRQKLCNPLSVTLQDLARGGNEKRGGAVAREEMKKFDKRPGRASKDRSPLQSSPALRLQSWLARPWQTALHCFQRRSGGRHDQQTSARRGSHLKRRCWQARERCSIRMMRLLHSSGT